MVISDVSSFDAVSAAEAFTLGMMMGSMGHTLIQFDPGAGMLMSENVTRVRQLLGDGAGEIQEGIYIHTGSLGLRSRLERRRQHRSRRRAASNGARLVGAAHVVLAASVVW